MKPKEIVQFCAVKGCNQDVVEGSDLCAFHYVNGLRPKEMDSYGPVQPFDEFVNGVRNLVESKAAEKGYNEGGTDRNDLMEFTNKFFQGHAGGEIVYKAIRYSRKKDKQDLLKIAAWAYLLYVYDK